MTTTSTPERSRRVAAYWTSHPNLSSDQVLEAVDAEIAIEAERQAEAAAKTAELVEAMNQRFACQVCGVGSWLGARDGFCDACRPVVARVRAERLESDRINGRTRRELASAYLDRRA